MNQLAEPDYVAHRDNHKLDHIPGHYGLPLLGETFSLLSDPYPLFERTYQQYGPISKHNLTFQKLVMALGPDYIKLLTLDPEQIFSPRMGYDAALGDFFRGGLLMRDFGEHKIHRRIMQGAFKTSAMRDYVAQMHPIVDSSLQRWQRDDNFLFYPNIKRLLLDIGANIFLGLDLGGSESERLNRAFLDMMDGSLALIRRDWPGLLYRRGMNGRRELERFFLELVPLRRQGDGTDMASFFSRETDDEGQLFSDQVVAEHLIFLLLAAHDTTTSLLTMTASFLAHHQDWQERLREEINATGHSPIEYDDLGNSLNDCELVFKEVLRLHPSVPQFMRRTIRDTEIDGHRIPAHTIVQVSPLFTHRMEEWWSDPHNFDPDRFAPGREEHKQHAFQWAPFGGGAHKCIGLHFANMLFKCVLADVLPKYRLKFADGYKYPHPVQHFPFAKPKDDLPLILEPIS